MSMARLRLQPRLVASPACLPGLKLEQLLPVFQRLGFTKLELFTEWSDSQVDWRGDPGPLRALVERHGLRVTSMHLPTVREPVETAVTDALNAARFAAALGADTVLFKAGSMGLYGLGGRMFLDALEAVGSPVVPVLQNHAGTVISTPDDFRAVFVLLQHDPRMKALLEVGHFQRIGVGWMEGWKLLEGRIGLIHINEIHRGQSVPYGTGEVDFAGLLRQVDTSGYNGNVVVELELENQRTDPEETIRELAAALSFLARSFSPHE